ncbi:MAG: CpsD/CapB family tyrosine-protein kinase [Clostridium sp.]|nr:CpsD/CapB family tyrosine-protein kinase [Clostridium sp.]
MRVYLIAGANGGALKQILERHGDINVVRYDRNIEEAFFYLKGNKEDIDIIFLVDQGINCSMSTFGRLINDFKELMDKIYPDTVFKYITKEPQYKNVFEQATGEDKRFFIYFVDKIKIPTSLIVEICRHKGGDGEPGGDTSDHEKKANNQDKGKNRGTKNFWNFIKTMKKTDNGARPQKEKPTVLDDDRKTEEPQNQQPDLGATVLLSATDGAEEIAEQTVIIKPEVPETPQKVDTVRRSKKLPFIGAGSKEPDIARRSDEIPPSRMEPKNFDIPGQTGGPAPSGGESKNPDILRQSSGMPLFRTDPKKPSQPISGKVGLSTPLFSTNINRFIAITGHRGSGVTSTAANLAMEASVQGLKTIIIDFDLDFRAMNLYYSKFGEEVNLNPELWSSLIKCLVKPESYEKGSCRINSNLSLMALAYSIDSKDKIMELINVKRLITLATVLKTQFNLVIMDIPIEWLKDYDDILIHLDSVALCINNSLYSVINTVSSMGKLERGSLGIMAMKSKVIITNYNEQNLYNKKPLTPEVTCEILSELSGDVFSNIPQCVGKIPYSPDFDQQVETGKKLCTINDEFKGIYINILNGIFK